jgi:diguanylate cyclase (GGDEF)-like protein
MFVAGYLTARRRGHRTQSLPKSPAERVQDATRISQQLHASVLRLEEELSVYRSQFDTHPAHPSDSQPAPELLNETTSLIDQLTSTRLELHDHVRRLINAADARFDPVTGLGSQREANRWMENLLAIMARYGNDFSIAIVTIGQTNNLDENEVNNRLSSLGQLLRSTIRETDVLARYSEDELLVILPETNEAGALVMAQRVRQKAAAALEFSVAIGVAGALPGDSYKSLIHRADAALFAAQELGGCSIGCQRNGLETITTNSDTTPAVASSL